MDGTPRVHQSPCRGLGAHPAWRHVPPAHTAPLAQPWTLRSPSTGRPGPSGRAPAVGNLATRVGRPIRSRMGGVHRLGPQQHPTPQQLRSLGPTRP